MSNNTTPLPDSISENESTHLDVKELRVEIENLISTVMIEKVFESGDQEVHTYKERILESVSETLCYENVLESSTTKAQYVTGYTIAYNKERKRLELFSILENGERVFHRKIHGRRLGKRYGKYEIDKLYVDHTFKPVKPVEHIEFSFTVAKK